ncbi:MAG: RHS repeat protein [Armatimonadetes bacterium]|nr:RHS repeat protein [Armatimonadota bacterium]
MRSWVRTTLTIVVCFALVLSQTAVAMGSVSSAIAAWAEIQRRKPAKTETDRPTPIFKGANPRRDGRRASWWTPKLLRDLRANEHRNWLRDAEGADLYAFSSLDNLVAMSFQTGGGSGSEGGGQGSGEGGSGSGGSGTTGTGGSGSGTGVGGGGGGGGGVGSAGTGMTGLTNTNTGNKLSELPIVGWGARGDLSVGFGLVHNSKNNVDGEFGYGWVHSYEVRLDYTPGSSAILHMPDGLTVPFTETSGTFTPAPGFEADLVKNGDGTFCLTFRDKTRYWFSAQGYLMLVFDRFWNAISLNRSVSQRVTSIQSNDGRYLVLSYDADGHVFSVLDSSGREWRFNYNSAGDLASVDYPTINGTNPRREFSYSAAHDILTEKDFSGRIWSWTYDSQERMTSATDPAGLTRTYAYGSTATTITLPGGQTVVDNYSDGLLVSRVDPAGFSDAYTYDTGRRVLTHTDKRGKVWTYTYDTRGNLLTAKDPLNRTVTTTYNTDDRPVTITDPNGAVTTFSYGFHGVLTSATDPLGRVVTTSTYDALGQVTSVTDALGRTSSFTYNGFGNVVSSTNPAGQTTTATYDTMGRPLTTSDALGRTTTVSYDAWGRPVSTAMPGGITSSLSLDLDGRTLSGTDPLGRVGTVSYDAGGRVVSSTNAKGESSSLTYDSSGRVVASTNARGFSTTYTYTSRGQLATMTLPDGAVESYAYNAAGQATAFTNPVGQTILYAYDDAGQMTAIDYPTGTDTTFTYDAGGRRTSMTDSTGTTTWTYNAASELVGLSQPGSTLSYAYNAAGQRTAMTRVGTGTTTTSYDAFGRVASVTNPFGETTSLTYDGLSRPVVKTMANGFTESMVYDAAGRPSTVQLKDGSGAAVRTETYTYDLAGNVLSATRNGTATTYTYDAIDQLLTESKPGYSATYTYDANGNRLSRTVNGSTDTYSYDGGDKLLSVVSPSGTRTYSYDAAGRTTAIAGPSGIRTFTYDFESRITGITGPGFSGSYGYNGFDTRVSKVENGVSRAFVRDGSGVTAPVLSDGAADYTPGISERRGGVSTFFASVLKNSDVQVGASAVSAERQYDAFGNVLGSSGTWKSPFGYAGSFGYQEDESGYKLLGHRTYDPDTGRFLTRDPAKDGRNWYAYCGNNPVTSADPAGLEPQQRVTYLYKLVRPDGSILKFGITYNLDTRYSRLMRKWWDFEIEPIIWDHDRAFIRSMERMLEMEMPGEWNYVKWAGTAANALGKACLVVAIVAFGYDLIKNGPESAFKNLVGWGLVEGALARVEQYLNSTLTPFVKESTRGIENFRLGRCGLTREDIE